MNPICVQLIHPGNEIEFKMGDELDNFFEVNNEIIRDWNRDRCHYRKLIKNTGIYLSNLNSRPVEDDLIFWGEWEGYSTFLPIKDGKGHPSGIHFPFHSTDNIGHQNTDPYVFGDFFKYAICAQRKTMQELAPQSLILFGRNIKDGFQVDTVFVIKDFETAESVSKNDALNYTKVYREETLERLINPKTGNRVYLGKKPSSKKRLYRGQTWKENKEYFSFVPCSPSKEQSLKLDRAILTEKELPYLEYKQFQGFLFNKSKNHSPEEIWKDVVNSILKQGFSLGIHLNEPESKITKFNRQGNIRQGHC